MVSYYVFFLKMKCYQSLYCLRPLYVTKLWYTLSVPRKILRKYMKVFFIWRNSKVKYFILIIGIWPLSQAVENYFVLYRVAFYLKHYCDITIIYHMAWHKVNSKHRWNHSSVNEVYDINDLKEGYVKESQLL